MSVFPTISRVAASLKELDAFKKADPVAQPDCPQDLKPWLLWSVEGVYITIVLLNYKLCAINYNCNRTYFNHK